MTTWFKLAFIFISLGISAAETDGFTARYLPIDDALPRINKEVNERLSHVLVQMNKNIITKNFCDWGELNTLLGDQLRRPLVGQIETFISFDKTIPKSVVDFAKSVYKKIPSPENIPLKVGAMLGVGFTPQIHHDGLLIGADKFGHFLDEGYYYYLLVYHWDYKLEQVLDFGTFTESNFYGKLIGGIYSYADLVANYEGYLFWIDVLGKPRQRSLSKYIDCQKNHWSQKQFIDLAVYINPAWDEGMNCNDFRSDQMLNGLSQSIEELEKRYRKKFSCPVFPHRVPEMVKRYSQYSKQLLHPSLLK